MSVLDFVVEIARKSPRVTEFVRKKKGNYFEIQKEGGVSMKSTLMKILGFILKINKK